MAKDTFYFTHDYNSRNDPKIKKLISKHKFLGYGIFWAIIEDLYQNANALPTDYESIAFDLRTDPELVKSIICDFDLFQFDGEEFGSKSVETRLNARNAKSLKARESALNRWNKSERNANALPTQSDCNAIKESKVNENKVNESSEITLTNFKVTDLIIKNILEMNKILPYWSKLARLSPDQTRTELTDFLTEKKLLEKTYINLDDLKHHITSWFKKTDFTKKNKGDLGYKQTPKTYTQPSKF